MRIISWDIGIKNLAYCILVNNKIEKWDTISLIKEDEKVKKISLNTLTERLIKEIMSKEELFNIDYVLLENQPCLKNPIMKSLQIIIYTVYFLDKLKRKRINEILLINACNKLKVYKGPVINLDVKSSYQKRKKLSVLHTQYFLKETGQEEILKNINKKKIDDLCDTYLQGLYFYNKILEEEKIKGKNKNKLVDIFIEDIEINSEEDNVVDKEEVY
jgi:hypothetical protein